MAYLTKRRVLRVDRFKGLTTRDGGVTASFDIPIYSRQITSSEGHRWPKARGVRDVGGPFDTLKLEYLPQAVPHYGGTATKLGLAYTVDTDCLPYRAGMPTEFLTDGKDDSFYQQFVPQSSEGSLLNAGTSFIAQTIPTNPVASGSVAMAELYREGLPSLIGASLLKERASFLRGLGGEYLNVQFGWKPLVADLKAAAKAIIDSDDILKQLARDSGRNVHRRRMPSAEVKSTVIRSSQAVYPGLLPSAVYQGISTRFLETELVTRQQWFSGCYTFYVDPKSWSTVERIVKEARLLYGVELTPEVLWNLAPWSWLVDWMFDVGPVLHNLSAFQSDGLVLRYGYVMEQNSRRWTRRSDSQYRHINGGAGFGVFATDTFLGTRKCRRKATPFGFGLSTDAFTTHQWSILAALGMTRAPRSL